jgi:hypothetical protein
MGIQVRLTIFYSILILTLKKQIGVGIDVRNELTRSIGGSRKGGWGCDRYVHSVGRCIHSVGRTIILTLKRKNPIYIVYRVFGFELDLGY